MDMLHEQKPQKSHCDDDSSPSNKKPEDVATTRPRGGSVLPVKVTPHPESTTMNEVKLLSPPRNYPTIHSPSKDLLLQSPLSWKGTFSPMTYPKWPIEQTQPLKQLQQHFVPPQQPMMDYFLPPPAQPHPSINSSSSKEESVMYVKIRRPHHSSHNRQQPQQQQQDMGFNATTWWLVDLKHDPPLSEGATPIVAQCLRQSKAFNRTNNNTTGTTVWDEPLARRVLKAYRQYLTVVTLEGDWNNQLLLAPPLVDYVWKAHIQIDLATYCHDCMILCGHVVSRSTATTTTGDDNLCGIFDNDDIDGDDDDSTNRMKQQQKQWRQRRDFTLKRLKEQFGNDYDCEIWSYINLDTEKKENNRSNKKCISKGKVTTTSMDQQPGSESITNTTNDHTVTKKTDSTAPAKTSVAKMDRPNAAEVEKATDHNSNNNNTYGANAAAVGKMDARATIVNDGTKKIDSSNGKADATIITATRKELMPVMMHQERERGGRGAGDHHHHFAEDQSVTLIPELKAQAAAAVAATSLSNSTTNTTRLQQNKETNLNVIATSSTEGDESVCCYHFHHQNSRDSGDCRQHHHGKPQNIEETGYNNKHQNSQTYQVKRDGDAFKNNNSKQHKDGSSPEDVVQAVLKKPTQTSNTAEMRTTVLNSTSGAVSSRPSSPTAATPKPVDAGAARSGKRKAATTKQGDADQVPRAVKLLKMGIPMIPYHPWQQPNQQRRGIKAPRKYVGGSPATTTATLRRNARRASSSIHGFRYVPENC